MPSSTSGTIVVVVMLTTAGLSRSASSEKLSGTKRGPGSTVSGAALAAARRPSCAAQRCGGARAPARKRARA